MRHYEISLLDVLTGKAIQGTGGKAYVASNGATAKATLYNKDGTSLVNPITPTNGKIEFYTADAVAKVDLYIQTPKGFAVNVKDVAPSGPNEICVDRSARQTLVIPFSIANTTAATETDTGFDLPTNAIVQPNGTLVEVTTVDATEQIDVGILSSESGGDADGFLALLSVATAAPVLPAVTVTAGVYAANTFGALISDYTVGTNADDRGLFNTKQYRCNGTARSISYTLTTGSDTAEGFIKITYELPVDSLKLAV